MTSPRRSTERVDRIIDASAELLSRRGYRGVPVEEIASRAGVSKSSVYLHWDTKDEIFYDVLDREFAALACCVVDHIRRDPAEVLAHRAAANVLCTVADRPLLQALMVEDRTILGSLQPDKSPVFRARIAAADELMCRYMQTLQRNALLCPEIDPRIMCRATHEMLRGMVLSAGPNLLDGRWRAELSRVMTVTVRRAFEPAGAPASDRINSAAAEVFEAFAEFMAPEEVRRVDPAMAL